MSAELAITAFILASTGVFFLLPSLIKKFSDHPIVDLLLKRCCYIIGIYLMVMNSGVMLQIATNAGYSTGEITRYLWLFGMGGYLLMIGSFLKMFFDLVSTWHKIVRERRGLI